MHTRLSSRNRVISECIVVIYCRFPVEKKKEFPRPAVRMMNFPLPARF